MFFCEPGYFLIGNPEIYCDGRQWNGTIPYCRSTAIKKLILFNYYCFACLINALYSTIKVKDINILEKLAAQKIIT